MKKSILIDGKPFFYDAEDLSYETTTAMSHEAGVKLLALTKKLFDAKNMKFYLAFGTLLGAIREHDIIKGDEDLDIFVINEDAFKQIIPYFDEKGLHLIRVIPGDTYSFRSDANSYIDIYILHKIHKFNIWRFYCYSLASMYTPKRYVKDFQNIDFLGMTFECPRNPEKLVEFWYGKTWRTPIRGHKFYYEVKSRYYWKNLKKTVKKLLGL